MTKDTNDAAHSPLLPCAHCGSNKVAVLSGVSWAVKCEGCWSIRTVQFNKKEDAIDAWNTRHNAHQDLVDALINLSNMDKCHVSEDAEYLINFIIASAESAKQVLENSGVKL